MASYYNQINGLAPKVWYRFNETAGTPTNSGSLSTTSIFNDLLLNEQTDVDGRCVYFNGSTSYIRLPNWPSFSLFDDRSFTTEVWFKIAYADTSVTGDDKYRPIFLFIGDNDGRSIGAEIGTNFTQSNGTGGRGKLIVRNYIGTTRSYISTETFADDKWHHLVVVNNTTSFKVYVDGVLKSNQSLSASPTSIDFDNNAIYPIGGKVIGGRVNEAGGDTIMPNGNKFKGRLDELAIYDRELTSTEINDNFIAGSSVLFTDIPGTASALAIQPTLSVTFNGSVDPMIASPASFPLPNATMYPQGLEDKLSSYALELWYKFDLTNGNVPYNYGTGGEIGNNFQFTPTGGEGLLNNFGPNGTSALKLGTYFGHGQLSTSGTDLFTTEISDENFSLGLWFKIDGTENLNRRLIHTLGTGTNHRIYLFTNTSGYINFQYWTSSGSNGYTGSTDLRNDGLWHFAAIRVDGTNVRYYLDGVEVQNQTVTGSRSTPTIWRFGNAGPDGGDNNTASRYYISNFYVASHSEIDATDIDEIWDAGRSVVEPIQARSTMVQPTVSFYNAFNNKVIAENAKWAFGFNNTDAEPINYGTAGITDFQFSGTPTKSIATKNQYAWKFTNTNQYQQFYLGSTEDPSSTGYTLAFYGRMTDPGQGNTRVGCWFGKTTSGSTGNYMFFGVRDDGPFAAYGTDANNATTWNRLDTGDTSLFNDYHLYVITKDIANNTWKFYVDGALESNRDDAGSLITSGPYGYFNDSFGYFGGSASWDNYVDEFAYFPHSLTAQEVFELWQSIEINNADDVSSTFVMPAIAAGFGPTVNADEATASAELVDPASAAETNELAIPMDAFAEFILPNFGGNVVIDANYGHTAATADAELPDPQFQIGDFHSADHMDASALMVQPIIAANGTIVVSTAVTGIAEFVMPGIVTIKGARHFAEPMRSQAIFPLPPAYIQLSDDEWFVRLLEGHADKKEEFLQQQVPSGTISVTDIIKGGFLSFFDDVLTDLTTTTSPNSISSEIPAHYFDRIGLQRYDSNGNILPLDTSKAAARVTPSRGSLTPSPMVSKGYFDDQERRAVRVENIEIPLPGTNPEYSIRPYHLEFSFKTTKSNQVIAYGQYQSFLYTNSRKAGAIGLYNGRIYLAESFYTPVSAFGEGGLKSLRIAGTVPHPANFTDVTYVNHMLGNKRVDDGQWHHIIIQKGFTDGRTQIWIDGVLDKQLGVQSNDGRSSGYANIPGSDGSQEVRPYIIGFNSSDINLYSDFQTSAWNYYPGRFLEEREITLNYSAFRKFKPIKVEPMTATAKATDNNKGAGNKARALLLYWWPVTRQFGSSESLVSNDNGQFGPDDVPTFDTSLYTYDYVNEQPQDYYGWDIFPLSITGYKGMLGGDPFEFLKPGVLQSNGLYIDSLTSAPRYLDVVNDIDLTQFDAIFFRNYPDQSQELDAYVREQFADQYFNVKEKDLYDNFIKSLRAAVDTGVSLFITNAQLALDLGIIDKYEVIPDFNEGDGDTYGLSLLPTEAAALPDKGVFKDVHRNNRLRVVNTIDGLTNEPGYIWKDWVFFYGGTEEDPFSGEPNRPFISLENRPNGLQVGDTFVISSAHYLQTAYDAVPFTNVRAGKVVTAFANTIRQGNVEIDNPYKNYATSIAVEPGTFLKGRPVGGKIFVNFTERLTGTISAISGRSLGSRSQSSAKDNFAVDLIQDEWINLAYNEGEISLATRDELLAASYNLDRRLEAEIAGLNRPTVIANIQKQKTWDSNGMYILVNRNQLNDPTGAGVEKDGLGKGIRRSVVNKVKKSGDPGTSRVSTSMQWFQFEYSWQYPRTMINAISMLTRGFRWLSNKVVDEGLVNRVEVMTAIATGMPMPVITGDKPALINAAAMVANARIVHAPGYALADVSNTTLPLTAIVKFGDFVKNIVADVFTASAVARQPRISGIQEDEIVVYIMHVDPILYLREEVIK